LLREIQILRRLSKAQNEDSFAPRLIDIIVIKDQNKYADNYTLFLVSEYFGSSLKDLIDLGSESKLNYNHLLTIFFNSLMALRNIHSANIIHRDIQPSNILVNQKCQVKINDFNMARTLPKK
jgi:serine/threonine protein kinase